MQIPKMSIPGPLITLLVLVAISGSSFVGYQGGIALGRQQYIEDRKRAYDAATLKDGQVVIALHNLKEGSVLGESDVETRGVNKKAIDQYVYTDKAQVVGKILRGQLISGQAVSKLDIVTP